MEDVVAGVRKEKKPFVLGKRGEEILRHMHFYRYMTALDVCHLMYSPSSLNRVRSLLAELSGGGDFIGNQYLYRFRVPDVEVGTHRVYTLGSRGRDFLESECGIACSWYFRPEKVRNLSYGQIMHNLVLTRFLVGMDVWRRGSAEWVIPQMRICYEIASSPVSVTLGGGDKAETLPVVPDAWIMFERVREAEKVSFPVLLEIDRGTMYRQRFKRHIASRIGFVRSGGYSRLFGTKAVMIVYATAGERMEEREGRRRAIAGWTKEVLREMRRPWAGLFRFGAFSFRELYKTQPFGKKVWYRPDEERPVLLFEG
jgi:hypothetical protein